jgi:hypothetical protein
MGDFNTAQTVLLHDDFGGVFQTVLAQGLASFRRSFVQ